jgi:ribosomal protein S8
MPLIKKTAHNEFRHFLSLIRIAMLDDRAVITFSKRKFIYESIMQALLAAGFIAGFEERGEFVIVRLKQTYWQSAYKPLLAFTEITRLKRIRRKNTISKQDVFKLQRLKGHSEHFFISTDQGIQTNFNSSRSQKGGIPLFRIK